MATKILLACAAFVALAASSQMIRREHVVYMPQMGYVRARTRRTRLAFGLLAVALLLVTIAWVVYPA